MTFWKCNVSKIECLGPSPDSLLLIPYWSTAVHPALPRNPWLILDSPLPLTFYIQSNSKYSDPCPPSPLHTLAHTASPLPQSPCFSLNMQNTLPVKSVPFPHLLAVSSSPMSQHGALLTLLKLQCQRICLWWPYPTVSPFISFIFVFHHSTYWASQVTQVVKNLPANAGDTRDAGSFPGLGISPGLWNGNPLQYSGLKSPRDRGACWAAVYGVTQSWTRLTWLSSSNPFQHSCLESFMARGAWQATVHGAAKSDMTEHTHIALITTGHILCVFLFCVDSHPSSPRI